MSDDHDVQRDLCRQFTATLLASTANDTVAVQTTIRPDDVELLDAPTAAIFSAAVGVARTGADPTPPNVHVALLQAGEFAGHQGDLVKTRMLAASAGVSVHGYRLHIVAGQLLSLIFRHRLAAAGHALVEMSRDGSDADCWSLLIREGLVARRLYERMCPADEPEAAA